MLSVIMGLRDGDERIVKSFVDANAFWTDFFRGKESWSSDEFAGEFGRIQPRYEWSFSEYRPQAKECMVVTCLAAIYDEAEGWGDRRDLALRVAKGFAKSTVSLEIKGTYLRDAVTLFHLTGDPELESLIKRN